MIFILKGATFPSTIGTVEGGVNQYIGQVGSGGATYYTITYKYVNESGVTIKTNTTAQKAEGTVLTFATSGAPYISGYEAKSVSPASLTVTGDATVTYTYKVSENTGGSGGDSGGSEPETPVNPPSTSTPTLVQGYISGDSVNNELATRVRIDGLVSGPFSVECNDGYLIRAIQECSSTTPSASDTNIVVADNKKTSYSGGSAGKYYAITFCKTNASSTISPTESIVKSFSGTIVAITSGTPDVDDTVAGTDVPYTLVQGAHVQNNSSIYKGTNRVTTPKAIKGKFTVTVNSGYAIRAVYEYTKESGDTNGTMVAETSETRTSFTSSNDNKYYGVTFTYASPNAANNIAPTENIVASWKYV